MLTTGERLKKWQGDVLNIALIIDQGAQDLKTIEGKLTKVLLLDSGILWARRGGWQEGKTRLEGNIAGTRTTRVELMDFDLQPQAFIMMREGQVVQVIGEVKVHRSEIDEGVSEGGAHFIEKVVTTRAKCQVVEVPHVMDFGTGGDRVNRLSWNEGFDDLNEDVLDCAENVLATIKQALADSPQQRS